MGVPDIPLGQGNYWFDDHLTEATTTDQQNMNLQSKYHFTFRHQPSLPETEITLCTENRQGNYRKPLEK